MLWGVFTARMGAEYEKGLGKRKYAGILVGLQVLRVVMMAVVALERHWLITNTPTIYALYAFSMIDLEKWSQPNLEFRP